MRNKTKPVEGVEKVRQMIVKLLMWILTSLTQVTTLFVLRGTTIMLITPTLQLARTPGIVISGLLNLIASTFSTIGKYLVRLIFFIIASIISGIFKFVTTVVMGIFGLMFGTIMRMMMHLPMQGVEDLSNLTPGSLGVLSENGDKLVVFAIIIIVIWVLS